MPRISANCGNVDSNLNLPLSRLPLRFLLLLGICLWQSGCFEIIRRQSSDGGGAEPSWADPGNLEEGRDVQRDSVGQPAPDSTAVPVGGDRSGTVRSPSPTADTLAVDLAAPLSSDDLSEPGEQPVGRETAADFVERTLGEERPKRSEEERRRLAAARAARTRKQRESVKQVNEYVLWCIENEMWKEARLHLEQAASEDTLAGSLYNNLGLVYERLGLPDKAEIAYERAADLNPAREAYRANLRRFRRRREAADRADPARLDSLKMELEGLDVGPVQPRGEEPRNTLLPAAGEGVDSITRKQVTVERT